MWKAAFAGVAVLAGYPFYDTKLKFYHADTEENKACLKSIPSLKEMDFKPTPWLSLGILQAYYGSHQGHIQEDAKELNLVQFQRELLKVPDGGTISIDWALSEGSLPPDTPVLVFAHGITGGSNSPYIKRSVEVCQAHGYRVAVLQQRGINDTPLTVFPNQTIRPAYPGATDDFEFGLRAIKARYPQARMFGMGFSMGANTMLKYAGESGEKCLFEAMAAISCPYDIHLCILHIRKTQNKLVDYMLTENSVKLLRKNQAIYANVTLVDVPKALAASSHYDFDEFFTRRIFGFNSPEQLYESVSCKGAMRNIRKPVFALSSLNDPIIPYPLLSESCLPYSDFRSNPSLILVVTRHGGHLGWFTGVRKPKRVSSHTVVSPPRSRIP